MFLNITGSFDEVNEGILALGFGYSEDGADLFVEKNEENKLCINIKDGKSRISYCKKVDFFRGLMIWKRELEKGTKNFSKCETRILESNGIQLDLSRNAAMKVDTVKDFVLRMAKMGLDTLYMYMEDVYKIDQYPYFGYMRGAYSKDELKSIVSYAEILGVEVIPSIQTLGHMAKTLRWRYAGNMRDNDSVLLVGSEETYTFIEEMIRTMRECFKTDRIHIGMDEAYGMGKGAYLKKNGYEDPYIIMSKHLTRVMEITKKYGFKPMIWSDMYLTLGSQTGTQYDPKCKLPDNIAELIPGDIQLVYWDYFAETEKEYEVMFSLHDDMKRDIIFAGGIWLWGNVVANYGRTLRATKAAISTAKKYGIREVFATIWGDDGCETNRYEALLGMQLFAEYTYYNDVNDVHLAKMFNVCTGYNMDAFLLFDIDDLKGWTDLQDIDSIWKAVPFSKQILWQDILIGLFDTNYKDIDLEKKYGEKLKALEKLPNQGDLQYLFNYHKKLIEVLYKKCRIGIRIREAYKTKDIMGLTELLNKLYILKSDFIELQKLFSSMWLTENKPFGLEVIDLRFGGMIQRIQTAVQRIENYINGDIEVIEELEEEILQFTNLIVNHDKPIIYESRFDQIFSVQM